MGPAFKVFSKVPKTLRNPELRSHFGSSQVFVRYGFPLPFFLRRGGMASEDVPGILERLVHAGASPKQLGAVAAALGRAHWPPGCAQWPPNLLKRTNALREALVLQESLERVGVTHHHLSSAVANARQNGFFSGSEGRAARRIVRRANAARHDRFYPERPPGVFQFSESEEEISSIAGLDIADWYSSDALFDGPGDADAGAGRVGAASQGLHLSPLDGEPLAPPPLLASPTTIGGEPAGPAEVQSPRLYTERQVASVLDLVSSVSSQVHQPEAVSTSPTPVVSPYVALTSALECVHTLRFDSAEHGSLVTSSTWAIKDGFEHELGETPDLTATMADVTSAFSASVDAMLSLLSEVERGYRTVTAVISADACDSTVAPLATVDGPVTFDPPFHGWPDCCSESPPRVEPTATRGFVSSWADVDDDDGYSQDSPTESLAHALSGEASEEDASVSERGQVSTVKVRDCTVCVRKCTCADVDCDRVAAWVRIFCATSRREQQRVRACLRRALQDANLMEVAQARVTSASPNKIFVDVWVRFSVASETLDTLYSVVDSVCQSSRGTVTWSPC